MPGALLLYVIVLWFCAAIENPLLHLSSEWVTVVTLACSVPFVQALIGKLV